MAALGAAKTSVSADAAPNRTIKDELEALNRAPMIPPLDVKPAKSCCQTVKNLFSEDE
jgi:hypothetical protein